MEINIVGYQRFHKELDVLFEDLSSYVQRKFKDDFSYVEHIFIVWDSEDERWYGNVYSEKKEEK